MTTNFPTNLDALTNPSPTDSMATVSHADQHADANDAIEALQAKVGVNSSAVTTSLDYRVTQLEGATVTPGGSDGHIQYNDGGALGGSSSLTFDDTTGNVAVAGEVSATTLSVTNEYSLPTQDGNGLSVLMTDGAGNLTFQYPTHKYNEINPTGSFTLSSSHAGQKIVTLQAADMNLTLPTSAMSQGLQFEIINNGTGYVTVQAGTGVTLNKWGSTQIEPYQSAQIYCLSGTRAVLTLSSKDLQNFSLGSSRLTLSGENAVWSSRSFTASDAVGKTGRMVFKYVTTTSFTADIQLDLINYGAGTTSDFETSPEGWETTTTNTPNWDNLTMVWASVPTNQLANYWNRDLSGTPSSNTGLTTAASGSYYLYAETSVAHPATFWLRSPEVTFTSSTFSFYEARYGATMGQLDVYVGY